MNRVLLTTLFLLSPAFAFAADWPQFRGANGSGVSSEQKLPAPTAEKDAKWKADLPSRGVSSPVVVSGKVFVSCSAGTKDDRLSLLAFDAKTGKKLWQRQLAATGNTAAHPKTCMAANTPVADAKAVYCLFATGDLMACDHDGNLLWYRSMTGDYPTITNSVGGASSPVLYKDKLIVPMDNAGESFLAALDVTNGKNLWKTPRPRDINWTTPNIHEINSESAEVLLQSPKELTAFDIKDGKKKWTAEAGASIPSGTLSEGFFIAGSKGVSVFKLGEGKLEEVWKSPKYSTGYSSPLFYNGHIYATSSQGVVFCASVKDGKAVWDERLTGKQTISASPIAGDGKVYVVTESGRLLTFKAGGESAEVLGTVELKEEVLGTPAIADGCLFIRTDKKLWCFGK